SQRCKRKWVLLLLLLCFNRKIFFRKLYLTQLGRHVWFLVLSPESLPQRSTWLAPSTPTSTLCLSRTYRATQIDVSSPACSFMSPRASCPKLYFLHAICFTPSLFTQSPASFSLIIPNSL
ncbi:mCG145082, partial [Mus musculus]